MARLCASASGGPLWIRTRKCTAGTDLGLLASASLVSSGRRVVRTVLPDLGTGGYRAVRCYRLAIRAYQWKPIAHDADALGRESDNRHCSRCRPEREESFCAERFTPIFADGRVLVVRCSVLHRSHSQSGTVAHGSDNERSAQQRYRRLALVPASQRNRTRVVESGLTTQGFSRRAREVPGSWPRRCARS